MNNKASSPYDFHTVFLSLILRNKVNNTISKENRAIKLQLIQCLKLCHRTKLTGLFLECESQPLSFLLKAQQEQCHVTFSAIMMFLIFKFLFILLFWLLLVFVAVCGLSLIAVSRACSLVAVCRLPVVVASGSRMLRLCSCGIWACLPQGTWDLPGPGIKPCSVSCIGR